MKQATKTDKTEKLDLTALKAQCWDLSKELIRCKERANELANQLNEVNRLIEEATKPVAKSTHPDAAPEIQREV
jgi:chromosome segregation ATPase